MKTMRKGKENCMRKEGKEICMGKEGKGNWTRKGSKEKQESR